MLNGQPPCLARKNLYGKQVYRRAEATPEVEPMSARARPSLKAYMPVRSWAERASLKTKAPGVETLKKPPVVPVDIEHGSRISMLEELAASIAHEVLQPLSAIQMDGQTALRLLGGPDPEVATAREALQRVVASVRRTTEIVARMRDMATRRPPQQTQFSLAEAIKEALAPLRKELQSNGISVCFDADPVPSMLLGDRTQIQQVVVNLAVNALQAMVRGARERRALLIQTRPLNAESLVCSFEDSGPGIDSDHLSRVFDSFFTTKETGMGLGLSICRSIIVAHGGELRADNHSVLGGARFSVILPTSHANHCRTAGGGRDEEPKPQHSDQATLAGTARVWQSPDRAAVS
jgi:signal transduction histidine kinase